MSQTEEDIKEDPSEESVEDAADQISTGSALAAIAGVLFVLALIGVVIYYLVIGVKMAFAGINSSVATFHELSKMKDNIRYQFYAIDGINMSRIEKADILVDLYNSATKRSINIETEKLKLKEMHKSLNDDFMREQDAIQSYTISQMEFNAQIGRINAYLISSGYYGNNPLFEGISQYFLATSDSLLHAEQRYNQCVEDYNLMINRLPWVVLKIASEDYLEYCYFDVQSNR